MNQYNKDTTKVTFAYLPISRISRFTFAVVRSFCVVAYRISTAVMCSCNTSSKSKYENHRSILLTSYKKLSSQNIARLNKMRASMWLYSLYHIAQHYLCRSIRPQNIQVYIYSCAIPLYCCTPHQHCGCVFL